MSERTRIAAYLAGLVAVFGLAWTVGNATGDSTPVPPDRTHQTDQHQH